MWKTRTIVQVAAAVSAGALVAACGSGGGGGDLAVTTTVVTGPGTQDVQVVAPEEEGSWPVVVALHGLRGTGEDMVELGSRIAETGAVVFAPSYRSEFTTSDELVQATEDISCGYALALQTAAERGGDTSGPVIALGWSLGADFVLLGGLSPDDEPAQGAPCPGTLPKPDVVIGMAGCYYEFEGNPVHWFDDLSGWGNKDAAIYLLDGSDDTVCPASQTEQFAAALTAAGYQVRVVELQGANHYAPVFHDLRQGNWQVISDDPAGEQALDTIVHAIETAVAAQKDA